MMDVKFVDLKAQYLTIKDEIDRAIRDVIDNSSFSGGTFVRSFETNFAELLSSKFCIGVNSGTSALHLSLMSLGIGRGDEVIVPSNTFFATPQSVSLANATPIFVDCDPTYYNIDPAGIERAISENTKAIIAVNLYGQPAQLDVIKKIADKNNLFLIEDCAQSHLSKLNNKMAGTFGICGCFSFYPGKNLGAFGDAGAVITDDEILYKRMLLMREHGQSKKYFHDCIGHNYRMGGIQGAVLDVKLRYLQKWTERRKEIVALYKKNLAHFNYIILPEEMTFSFHVWHLFVIRVKERELLTNYLFQNGIQTGIHYPIPCHLQKAYSFLNIHKGSLPISEKISDEILSLPIHPELTKDEIIYVCEKIKEFYTR